jgi:hypothetical protein
VHVPASAFTVSAEGAVIVGFWLSVTVTSCVAVAVLPDPSVTVHVTVVAPRGNVAGASFIVVATEQLSAVVGVPSATPEAVQIPASALTETADGAVIVGFWLSVTVTICVAVAVFPEPSVTVQVTVVAPNGKLAGALFVVLATEQLSPVVGVPSDTPVAEHVPASATTLTAAGAVIVGLTRSCIVINTASVAVQPFKVEESVNVVVDGTVNDGVSEVDVKPAGVDVQDAGGAAAPEITMLSMYQLLMFQTSPLNRKRKKKV